MNHYNKIQELRQTQIREGELIGELRAFLKEQVNRIRKYQDGEKVEVLDDMGRSIGIGIVDFAFSVAGIESFQIAKYDKDSEKWEKEINEVVYRVNKIRKDGTKSTHRLATCHESTSPYQNTLRSLEEAVTKTRQ